MKSVPPDDIYFALQADPAGTRETLYRKVVHVESFGRQTVKPAELRWLFAQAHAAENGIAVDTYYINQAFDLTGRDYQEETAAFMAALPHGVNTTLAEFLLRPLSSGVLNLKTFPGEVLARICTPARLNVIFPLVIRAQ